MFGGKAEQQWFNRVQFLEASRIRGELEPRKDINETEPWSQITHFIPLHIPEAVKLHSAPTRLLKTFGNVLSQPLEQVE